MNTEWEFIIQDGKLIKRKKAPVEIKKKKKSGFLPRFSKTIIISAIVLGLLSGLTISAVKVISKYALLEVLLTTAPKPVTLRSINILVLGLDSVFGHRSDTIMLVNIDSNLNQVSLISIPRDTLVDIPGRGPDKINHAYAYGGVESSMATIAKLFNIGVPHYVTVDVNGLAEIIDKLGGLSVNVEKRMYYVDYAGNLYVDLWPGTQTLNGKQAVAYVRYRSDGGDLKRILRQQNFLNALANKLMDRKNLIKTPNLFFKLVSNVDTNMNTQEILSLAMTMRAAYEYGNLRMTSLKGYDLMQNGIYYMQPDQAEIKRIADNFLSPPHKSDLSNQAKKIIAKEKIS